MDTTGWPGALGLRDLVLVMGKAEVVTPVWTSKRSPRYFIDIAEHSTCHPGKPSPHGLGHVISRPVPAAFHSAKSASCRFAGSVSRSRWPAFSLSSVLPDSRP